MALIGDPELAPSTGAFNNDDAFEHLLGGVLAMPLWDTVLVGILTALGEDLECDGADASCYDSVAHRLALVVEQLGSQFVRLAESRRGVINPPGPPGAEQYLQWMGMSLQEAQGHLEAAVSLRRRGGSTDDVARLLGSGLYFTSALASQFGAYSKFMPAPPGARGVPAGN